MKAILKFEDKSIDFDLNVKSGMNKKEIDNQILEDVKNALLNIDTKADNVKIFSKKSGNIIADLQLIK